MCDGGSLPVVSILMFVAFLGEKWVSPEEEMHFHTPIPFSSEEKNFGVASKSVEQR